MSRALLNQAMVVMRGAIVIIVVGWILNIPGRLQISLFTEQMLVAVLGLALALTFLTFPLASGEGGEEAVVKKVLSGERRVAGPADIALALAALIACFYV